MKIYHGSPIPNIRNFSLKNVITNRKDSPYYENMYGLYFYFTKNHSSKSGLKGYFHNLKNYAIKKSKNGYGYLYVCDYKFNKNNVLSNETCTLTEGELLQICANFKLNLNFVELAQNSRDDYVYYCLCDNLDKEKVRKFYVNDLNKTCIIKGHKDFGTIIILNPEKISIKKIVEINKNTEL